MKYEVLDKVLYTYLNQTYPGVISDVLTNGYVKVISVRKVTPLMIRIENITDRGTHIKLRADDVEIDQALASLIPDGSYDTCIWNTAILSQAILSTDKYDLTIVDRVNKDVAEYGSSVYTSLLDLIIPKHSKVAT